MDDPSRDSGFEDVDVDFLLPNGYQVTMKCDRRSSLSEVKSLLWQRASKLPESEQLSSSVHYVLKAVTRDDKAVELNENMTVDDLKQLAEPVVEVSGPKLRKVLQTLKTQIEDVIGMPIQTLEKMSADDPEVNAVRPSLKQMCHRLAMDRENWSDAKKTLFFFPPKFDRNEDLPTCTARKIMRNRDNKIQVNVWFPEQIQRNSYTVQVPAPDPPHRVIEAAIKAKNQDVVESKEDHILECLRETSANYVLKVCGREEYMLQECCLHTYEYVRNCIDKDETPELELVFRDNIIKFIPENSCLILQRDPPEVKTCLEVGLKTSWELPHDNLYRIKVRSFPERKLQAGMYVQAQLFHGSQPLSRPMKTSEFNFNQTWEFDVPIESLPRGARLCFVACNTEKDKVIGLNWVNIQVFDHTRKLVTGRQVVNVTQFSKFCIRTEYPFGSPGSNPDKNTYRLEFDILAPCDEDVYFPSSTEIDEKLEREEQYHNPPKIVHTSFDTIDRIVHKDPLEPLVKSDKDFLWEHRNLAMDYQPNILPRVIQCVNWSERHDVFEIYRLLKLWPYHNLSLVTALQLLGPEYPDDRVRSLAVTVLEEKLSIEILILYLPQLVQAVKLESYQDNDLSRFLLGSALYNKRVGHAYFWNLRSEIHNGMSRLRFAPLLEAYCLYCGSFILDGLQKEVKALGVCRNFSREMNKTLTLDQLQKNIKSWLDDEETRSAIENQTATLDQNIELGEICVDECKVMSSKMKPLWITWKNRYPSCHDESQTVKYIVKDGDDLRQDMLVLQLIRLMDMIWKYTSRDYCITSYECMSMEEYFGMIEVVCGAKTVCDIEMHKQTGVMATTSMHAWLYEASGGGEKYLEAVRRFTLSCAGFCVITYLLGIGDRHSDNIMLKVTGELFHIDFGHFMNHKKDKYGITRERTPFVLTRDFITIVTKGAPKVNDSPEFDNFLYICLEAFMTIRRNGTLFLTLLSLMMHCDLPELQEVVDINYCRKCLALDKPEHEAANDFLAAIMEAYKGQWKTNIDWFLHRVNRVWQGMGSTS